MKKGQIEGQVLIYILATFIAIVILLYGYTAVKGLLETQQDILVVDFKNQLKSDVRKSFLQYGSFTTKEYVLPDSYTEICLVSKNALGTNAQTSSMLIINSAREGVMKDVFLFGRGLLKDSIFVDHLTLRNQVECFDIVDGILKLRIESKGREGVEISNV